MDVTHEAYLPYLHRRINHHKHTHALPHTHLDRPRVVRLVRRRVQQRQRHAELPGVGVRPQPKTARHVLLDRGPDDLLHLQGQLLRGGEPPGGRKGGGGREPFPERTRVIFGSAVKRGQFNRIKSLRNCSYQHARLRIASQ